MGAHERTRALPQLDSYRAPWSVAAPSATQRSSLRSHRAPTPIPAIVHAMARPAASRARTRSRPRKAAPPRASDPDAERARPPSFARRLARFVAGFGLVSFLALFGLHGGLTWAGDVWDYSMVFGLGTIGGLATAAIGADFLSDLLSNWWP